MTKSTYWQSILYGTGESSLPVIGLGLSYALRATNPITSTSFGLSVGDAAADTKNWELISLTSGEIRLRTANDAYNAFGTALSITRTGTTIGIFAINGTTINLTSTAAMSLSAGSTLSLGGTTSTSLIVNSVTKMTAVSATSTGADISLFGTGGLILHSGTTGQRPSSELAGMLRHNTTIGAPEFSPGSGWYTLLGGPIATGRVLANVSGVTGAPTATTIPVVLDSVIGAVQGTIMYRNGSTWTALTAGTDGDTLATRGTGANPEWSSTVITNIATLKALTTRPLFVNTRGAVTAGDGGGGRWVFQTGNQASNITADTRNGIWIPPSTDLTGASGAWRRQFDGSVHAGWFGYLADNSSGSGTTNSAALNAAVTMANLLNTDVLIPGGTSFLATTINNTGHACITSAGWEKAIIKPVSDAISIMFNLTGTSASMRGIEIVGDSVVSPTFTAIKIDSSGFNKLNDLYVYQAGIGLNVVASNAAEFHGLRIQNCTTCVQTGGTTAKFPGDSSWTDIVLIPTSTGTGWIIDGNTNAIFSDRVKTIGGAIGIFIRGAGASTAIPDGLFFNFGNFTASSAQNVKIVKGSNIWFDSGTSIGGCTAGEGLLIDPVLATDVDGIFVRGSQIRGNFKQGIKWNGGANLCVEASDVHGNSNGGGSGTYSNIYVGAAAVGLFQAIGVMAGLSSTGNLYGNVVGPAKYGIDLVAGSLTDSGNFPGRVIITDCVLDGNVTGDILDLSAPTGIRKMIRDNIGPSFAPKVTVVGSLPSASVAGVGTRSFVTDANATTFLSTVAGGGSNKVPVVSDGTNWLIG